MKSSSYCLGLSTIFLILWLFSVGLVSSQQLVLDGNQWNIASHGTFVPNTTSFVITLGEEITIDSLTFHKVYVSLSETGEDKTFTGDLLREDNSVVYHRRTDEPERVLYNFQLEPNDVIVLDEILDCTARLIRIDTVYLRNSEPRKRFHFILTNDPHPREFIWIEGIGNEKSLLFPGVFCYVDLEYELLCFYSDGELLYPENPISCFIVDTDEPSENNYIRIQPNPFSQSIHFFSNGLTLIKLLIFDVSGRLVFQEDNIHQESYKADLSLLAKGMYFAIIEDSSHLVSQYKILKYE